MAIVMWANTYYLRRINNYPMKNCIALFLGCVLPWLAQAQQPGSPCRDCLVVIGEARLELPADQVNLSIQLRYTHPTDAQQAYTAHVAAEQRLAKLLRDFAVSDKDVVYTLLSVQKNVIGYDPGREPRQEISTDQRVIIKFRELKRYPDLQLALIGAGFNQFNAVFGSTQAEENKQKAIEKAVEVARSKADIMAKAAGRRLGPVLSIRDTEEIDPYLQRRYAPGGLFEAGVQASYGSAADNSLFTIPQKIVVPAQVNVTFRLR